MKFALTCEFYFVVLCDKKLNIKEKNFFVLLFRYRMFDILGVFIHETFDQTQEKDFFVEAEQKIR